MKKTNKFLRTFGIVLLAVTAAFTLLGGAGTACVAFGTRMMGSMAKLEPVKPIFQVLVVVSIVAALLGIYATFRLGRGKKKAYLLAMIFLVVGLAASAIQYYFSLTLRGSTAPNNIRLYLTALTLLVFLILRLPPIWAKTGYENGSQGNDSSKPTAMAMLLCGLVTLAMPIWGAPTHIFEDYIPGFNTVNLLLAPLMIAGCLLVLGSVIVFFEIEIRAWITRPVKG